MNVKIRKTILSLLQKIHYEVLPDKLFLIIKYFLVTNELLNLRNPQKFTHKIQWLKLYNRKHEYTKMVDKIAVKDYVANKIGVQYVIPTIQRWSSIEEINLDSLPNSFVLKTNNGGGNGGIVICKDKNHFNYEESIKRLKRSLESNIYLNYREWPYKNVVPQVFAEPLMKNGGDEELIDYKFYCFNGIPVYCQVIADRKKKETIDFYDMEWNHQPFYGLNPECLPAKNPIKKPSSFCDMVRIARILSADIPFVRIDLYDINDKVYFGEITFFPASGMGHFTPNCWDYILGSLIQLPKNAIL